MPRKALAAVVGVGHSRIFRRAEVPLGQLAREASLAAIADAGLKPGDIDGIATNPEQPYEGAGDVDGIHLVTPGLMLEALGLEPCWSQAVSASTVGKTVIHAVHAVAAGACTHALVFKALNNPAGRYGHLDPAGIGGYGRAGNTGQFAGIYGVTPPAHIALVAHRYFHRYGLRREDLGRFVVENRKTAMLWDWGYWKQYRPEPLSLDEYMGARMVAWPMGLHDCDLPVHGAAAIVITTPERARDLPHRPAYVLGTASPNPIIPNRPWAYERMQAEGRRTADLLYQSAGVAPHEVSVANLYDGFSIFTPLWMEAFRLASEGEGLRAIADRRSRIAGELPINPSSGNLGAGRMHGFPHILDSVLQVMGRSGARQAKQADIALAMVGPLDDGAGMLFARQPD